MTPPGSHPRRILMTTDTVGGVWNYALELCRGLGAHGVQIVLATMGPRADDEQRRAVARLEHVRLCESEFRLEWMRDPWADVERAGDWLLELEWRYTPEVIHLNGYAHGALPWRAPALIVAHSCVCSWWRAVRGGAPSSEWSRYRRAVMTGLRGAQMVIAPTCAMLRALEDNYEFLPESVVVPNGRSAADYGSAAEKEPFVLSVGRLWDEAKNAHALTAVAPQLAWPVRLVGDPAGPDGRVREFPNVETLGRRAPEEVAALYARAAIYALPARYEPFGLSALEAALSGCALVLGDIPSLRENWRDAAVFVAPDDHDALADAINRLIREPARREQWSQRARERARQFSVEQMVAGYFGAYERLLTRRSALATPISA